jgi:hypothetical protein
MSEAGADAYVVVDEDYGEPRPVEPLPEEVERAAGSVLALPGWHRADAYSTVLWLDLVDSDGRGHRRVELPVWYFFLAADDADLQVEVVALTDPAAQPWVDEVMAPGAGAAGTASGRAAYVIGDAAVILTDAALIRATLTLQAAQDQAACEQQLRDMLGES